MKILDDLISAISVQSPVREIRMGVFHTAVVTKHCGLAATLSKDAFRQKPPLMKDPGALLDKDVSDLIHMAYSRRILEAAIGMATINSMIDVDENFCVEQNAADLIMEKGENKKIAIIGHFPFLERVRKIAKELWVLEKNPKEGDFDDQSADVLIPQADVVGITGTSFTNHTIGNLLALCDAKAYVIMLGDTTPMLPMLFEYGIDALSGTMVVDTEAVLRCVSQGANYRQIIGVRKLIMMKK